MNLLTLPEFITHLSPFAQNTSLLPLEALRLVLLVTELLVDHYVDFHLLKFLARFLTLAAYDDIIEERNIVHLCGYLLCGSLPKNQLRRSSCVLPSSAASSMHFQIYYRKPSIILPNTFLSQYCCKSHYQALVFYRNQLSDELLFARENILATPPFSPLAGPSWYENSITCLEDVLERHRQMKGEGKSLADVINMMSGLSVEEGKDSPDTSDLVRLIEDFEIIEHSNDEKSDTNADDHRVSESNRTLSECVA